MFSNMAGITDFGQSSFGRMKVNKELGTGK